MLGLYVSDHPLAGLERQLQRLAGVAITDLLADENVADGEQVAVAGLVTSVQHRVARNSGTRTGS